MPIQAPKGTRDILPSEIYRWHFLESIVRDVCKAYGYGEIRPPLFEHTELFSRGVGDTTDIVQKEMYTFADKAGRSITLRPEATAGVARAFIEHGMASWPMPQKMYYYGPMYRYENVQRGRYREFWQFGCETLGAPGPDADVELISLLGTLFKRVGLINTDLRINSIGCPACRPAYYKLLREYLEAKADRLCGDCRSRIVRNPLRVLDCKQERCIEEIAGAPRSLDHVCDECAAHFDGVKKSLADLSINYEIDKSIVRGLDYYTRTVFEYMSENVKSLGATICGGGRYDGLIGACGGPDTPGAGFSIGVERLLMELDSYGICLPISLPAGFPAVGGPDVFIAAADAEARPYAARLVNKLREAGVSAEYDIINRSLKAQMKYADKKGAAYAAVVGRDELASGKAVLRKMSDGTQSVISLCGPLKDAMCSGEKQKNDISPDTAPFDGDDLQSLITMLKRP